MRTELKKSSFIMWRTRVKNKISSKNVEKRSVDITRFKSKMQRAITNNKISKRK